MPTKSKPHKYIPIDEATTPRDGEVLCNRWWVVTPDGCIILWKGWSAQCNSKEVIAESLTKKLWPECEVRQLPAVYLGWIKERNEY